MVDGSQTIAWVDRRVGALTEARIEARQAIMRNTVDEARDLANLPPPAPVGELTWKSTALGGTYPDPYRRHLRNYAPTWTDQMQALRRNDPREWTPNGMRPR